MLDKIRILLIDDDEDDYVITQDIINDIPGRNYTLEWSDAFDDALHIIKETRHDVYLVDFRLGARDGLELIAKAIETGSTSPFILLTGQSDRETDEKAMRAGALDYLVKGTFSAFDLERSIRYSLEHAKNLEEIQKLNMELEERVEQRTFQLAEAIRKLEDTNKSLYEAEKEVRKALQKEKELNELKSRFVTTASHEFRTPLSTVLSSASLIGKYINTEDDEKRQKHVDRIKSAVSNLTVILNDFLSISRIEEGRVSNLPVLFDFAALAVEVKDEMQDYLKQGQQIIFEHEGEERLVMLDKQLMKNILINLLSNASKYSDDNKSIYLNTKVNSEIINLEVKDEGYGIPREDQVRLFSPFFRAGNVSDIQGTGLGLNIVKRYIDLMGGILAFQSRVNEGSTFTVTFTRKNTR